MFRACLVAAVALPFASPALAREPIYDPALLAPVAASENWTGFHFGGFLGGATGDVEATQLATATGIPYNVGGPYDLSPSGLAIGAQAGYDRQWNRFVVGAGGEIGFFHMEDSVADPSSIEGDTATSVESDLYGAATLRAGVSLSKLLLYARGGVAFLNARAETVDTCVRRRRCGGATVDASDSELLIGWTLGGGLEFRFDEHWSAGGEYRYYDFGELGPSGPGGVAAGGLIFSQDVDIRAHAARIFVNYRW
jgi:outer membrane immunogenic protein